MIKYFKVSMSVDHGLHDFDPPRGGGVGGGGVGIYLTLATNTGGIYVY